MSKKKKKVAGKKKESKQRKLTCIQFLRDLYKEDPVISNDKALKRLLAKFPDSNAGTKSIITWKKMLRDEGVKIPKQRAGRPSDEKAKKKVAKKSKKKRGD